MKKHLKSLLFWILLPLVASILFVVVDPKIEDQIRIPIGVVMSEQTPFINEITQTMEELPLLDVSYLPLDEAMHQLENHQLDSVFEFDHNYDEHILNNQRSKIVSHYTSNMSFASIPVKESIVSFIQEQLNRSKAADTVEQLFTTYSYPPPAREDVVETSKDIQLHEQLIETSLSYGTDTNPEKTNRPLISAFHIWVFFVLFTTMMIFEWIIRERNHPAFTRLQFTAYQSNKYLMIHFLFYSALFVSIDLVTFSILTYGLGEYLSFSHLVSLISFRITCAIGLFLFALCFKQRFSYFIGCISLFIILIGTSGMIIPVDGIIQHFPLFTLIHPLQPVLHENVSYVWLIAGICLSLLWYYRKENANVTRT